MLTKLRVHFYPLCKMQLMCEIATGIILKLDGKTRYLILFSQNQNTLIVNIY